MPRQDTRNPSANGGVTTPFVCACQGNSQRGSNITESGNHSPSSAAAAFWSIDMNGISLVRCFVFFPFFLKNRKGIRTGLRQMVCLSKRIKKERKEKIPLYNREFILEFFFSPAPMVDDKWPVLRRSEQKLKLWKDNYDGRCHYWRSGVLYIVVKGASRGGSATLEVGFWFVAFESAVKGEVKGKSIERAEWRFLLRLHLFFFGLFFSYNRCEDILDNTSTLSHRAKPEVSICEKKKKRHFNDSEGQN